MRVIVDVIEAMLSHSLNYIFIGNIFICCLIPFMNLKGLFLLKRNSNSVIYNLFHSHFICANNSQSKRFARDEVNNLKLL